MAVKAFPVILPIAIACLLSACAPVDNEPDPDAIARLSESDFRCSVEPILIRDCSYPDCHGNDDTPLRVYSIGKLRMGDDSTMEARNKPLTEAEHHANYLSATGFTFGGVEPTRNMLLRKSLPVDEGGYEHVGGAVFRRGVKDKRTIAIYNWLKGAASNCSGGGG